VLLARLTPVRTIATSRRVADLLMEAGLSSERLEVVYNGCRREHFGDAHKAVRRARAALHLGDGPVVGTVARLSAEKGVDVLLTALGHVVEQVPSVTALIVGDGPRLVELREQTGRLGLNGHVRFLGARSDVAVLNRLMDVFVLPSRQEACPMALLEAMAAGRAIVATDVGGNRELIENARTGVLVPSEQPATLARQIVTALSHPRRRKKMGRAARARVGALFTRERMVTRTCAVYRRMLAARS
jgi:glycosyltransferase involved in cell wall biosynthesis